MGLDVTEGFHVRSIADERTLVTSADAVWHLSFHLFALPHKLSPRPFHLFIQKVPKTRETVRDHSCDLECKWFPPAHSTFICWRCMATYLCIRSVLLRSSPCDLHISHLRPLLHLLIRSRQLPHTRPHGRSSVIPHQLTLRLPAASTSPSSSPRPPRQSPTWRCMRGCR